MSTLIRILPLLVGVAAVAACARRAPPPAVPQPIAELYLETKPGMVIESLKVDGETVPVAGPAVQLGAGDRELVLSFQLTERDCRRVFPGCLRVIWSGECRGSLEVRDGQSYRLLLLPEGRQPWFTVRERSGPLVGSGSCMKYDVEVEEAPRGPVTG